MGNGISVSKILEMQLGILRASSKFSTMLSLSSFTHLCLLFSFITLSLFKVNVTASSEKGCTETSLFPNKVPNIFFLKVGLRMGMKIVFPKFWIWNVNENQFSQICRYGITRYQVPGTLEQHQVHMEIRRHFT